MINLINSVVIKKDIEEFIITDQKGMIIKVEDKFYDCTIAFTKGFLKMKDDNLHKQVLDEIENQKEKKYENKEKIAIFEKNEEIDSNHHPEYINGIPKRVLICNIGYMKYYQGDKLLTGGSFVVENGFGGEQYNFLNQDDGYTYGFVETMYKKGQTANVAYAKSLHIERIDSICNNKDSLSGVLVIFIANTPYQNGNIIVGWYDNANVYRNRRKNEYMLFDYNIRCLNSDAHLILEENRSFIINKIGPKGEYRFGQSYQWYIGEKIEHRELLKEIIKYIDSMR